VIINLVPKNYFKNDGCIRFTAEEITDLQTAITNDMSASAASALEKIPRWGVNWVHSPLVIPILEIKTQVDMEIKNVVENNITTTNVNNTVAEQVNIQDGELNLKYYDCSDGNAKLDFSQDIMSEVKATSIMNILKQSIASSKMLIRWPPRRIPRRRIVRVVTHK